MKEIYLDHSSTTPLNPEALNAMLPYFSEKFGNPSSLYTLGQEASDAVAAARETLASLIGASPRELYFTSGGTESDNWAIKGFAHANAHKGRHIITSSIEHHAVLHTCAALEKEGFEVTYLPVDSEGLVSTDDFEAAIRPNTILASIMFANNEIGVIQPIADLAAIAHNHRIAFHTDAVQAFAHIPIDVEELGVDMLSTSAHKLQGPKGIGFLYVRHGCSVANLLDGGQQERGKRATTENVPGIIGFAKAAEIAVQHMDEIATRQREIQTYLIQRVIDEIPYATLNGSATHRVPNNINFSFEFVEGESLLLHLAARGIYASSGSACTSGSLDPSHVLLALGLPHEIAHGSLRLSLGPDTTHEDAEYVVEALKDTLVTLRNMSPVYEDFQQGKIESILENSGQG